MSIHDDDTCPHLVRANLLEAENASLKQSLRLRIEQNALAQIGFKMYQDNVDSGGLHKDRKDAISRLEAENARLKAEVERLTSNIQGRDAIIAGLDSIVKCRDKQVERMTLAGDRLCDKEFVETMGDYEFDNEAYAIRIRNWHKAKGVQS